MKRTRTLLCCLGILCLLVGGIASPAKAAGSDPKSALQLTQAEQDFIREHPAIRLGVDPTFVPYEFIDLDGTYKGIAADYVALVSERTGLDLVVTPGLTWSEAYEKAVRVKSTYCLVLGRHRSGKSIFCSRRGILPFVGRCF